MTMKNKAAHLLLALASWVGCAAALAQAAAPAAPAASAPASTSQQGTAYTEKGADTCLECHDDEGAGYSASALFKGKHAQRGNKRAPFGPGGLQCEACHGPGAQHASKGSKKTLTINTFKADSFLSVEQRNQACLSCHNGPTHNAWQGSAHERAQVSCADCHKMHRDRDPALTKATEADVCYRCHAKQRADFRKTSAHPVRTGGMACSDCHNPHGSSAPAMLVKPTLNQTCYSCHAEKRGPMLWEHAPVAEDCGLCHTPHGSVRPALLTQSPPLLCQQCHSPAGHPSVARTGASLPGGSAGGAVYQVAGSCTNCHSQVHGSNHPAGAKLMR
jgi:DmsE family decaheme c-type cytochrome